MYNLWSLEMMNEDLKICRICGFETKSNNGMTTHLKLKHDLTLYEYVEQYFDVPICKYCNENKVEIYLRPLHRFKRYGRFWKLTCTNNECISKYNREIQKSYYENNETARELHRKHRIEYLKQRTGKSAWERRAAGEMSYLEQWFFENVIERYDLFEKYDIVNELCVAPYFIDFAFQNIKVAVELDGKCHFVNGESRNGHDRKKDEHLINHGWKVFRIGYTENNEEMIQEFLTYISKIEAGEKELPNRMFKYSEVKELNKPKRTWEEWKEIDYKRRYELNKPLIDLVKNSDIDFLKRGWRIAVSELIGKKPGKVKKWIKLYLPEIDLK
jgi:very-short-patch-repair endonuclease